MTWRERLEAAIAAARPECLECGNAKVTVEFRPALDDWVPVSHHWAGIGPDDSCPVLAGGVAAWLCHEDLWAALDPYLAPHGGVYGSYGEDAWARRQLAAA